MLPRAQHRHALREGPVEIHDIIKKSRNSEPFSREEVVAMLTLPAGSLNSYVIMGEAARISRELSDNRAEIHAQLALNLGLPVLFIRSRKRYFQHVDGSISRGGRQTGAPA